MLELRRQIAAAGDVLVKECVDDGYSGSNFSRFFVPAKPRHTLFTGPWSRAGYSEFFINRL